MSGTDTPDHVTSEDLFRRELREKLVARIEEQQLDIEELAKVVGMLPSGAQALMGRHDWTLRTCLRVAESLGVAVHPTLEERRVHSA